ncbi:hypothetical protein RB195_007741 [Necator americanus]|uniref:ShKT domain-containing protein n=1 Tax=Necator americanus TaxID=51031 RepID=A0ABR1BYT5_NECAM
MEHDAVASSDWGEAVAITVGTGLGPSRSATMQRDECSDAISPTVCANMKKYDQFETPTLKDMAEKFCPKTCGKCK